LDWLTTSTILDGLRDFENEAAWSRFVGRFHQPLVRFARRVGLESADAEDVAQEALATFAETYRTGRYDPRKGRLSQWLFGIAYKQILRQRQRDARRTARAAPVGGTSFWAELPDEQTASTAWDEEWEREMWRTCVEQVRQEVEPQTYRAFELAIRDDLPTADAARQLGVPVKTIYNAKHRVLKRIRELREALEAAT
jgi:RNA polymerase sigma-70 factor (ECF subfamily)